MNSIENKSIGELVAESIDRARVFEWFGIDYCCGGKMSLVEACRSAGVEMNDVKAEFERIAESRQNGQDSALHDAPVAKLIENIVTTHHSYLKLELPRLAGLVTKVASVHGERHPELSSLKETYMTLRTDLESHLAEEEELLFPMIRLMENPERRAVLKEDYLLAVSSAEEEHTLVGSLLRRMNELTGGYTLPNDGCQTYRVMLHGLMVLEQDIHLHVHKENNILFPRVSQALAA